MKIKRVLHGALKALAFGLTSIAAFHPITITVFERSKPA
jgi:hypothetical protein